MKSLVIVIVIAGVCAASSAAGSARVEWAEALCDSGNAKARREGCVSLLRSATSADADNEFARWALVLCAYVPELNRRSPLAAAHYRQQDATA